MSKKGRNYDQHAFKVGGSPEPADGITPEREKEKVTRNRSEESMQEGQKGSKP